MTTWSPDLQSRTGPRYIAIAEALASDIAEGRLKHGDRLPTHRDLAWRLGVTVGTVTRAYSEAERRGLISGEVGRGTFVNAQADGSNIRYFPGEDAGSQVIDLCHNYPPINRDNEDIVSAFSTVMSRPNLPQLLSYQPDIGRMDHRAAAIAWLERFGVDADPERVMLSNGGQDGMHLALAALTKPGDVVLTEELTFYGIKSLANVLSLKLAGVAMDEEGLLPDALDTAIRATGAKILYTIPTLQNPTTAIMSAERRREIAEICRRHEVTVLEDDIYGFLPEGAPAPISTLIPRQSIYLSSLSKSIAPALRIGYLRAEPEVILRMAAALRGTTLMANPITAAAAAELIVGGGADRLVAQKRAICRRRQKLAATMLTGFEVRARPESFHTWVTLPEPWRREEFAEEAQRRGVLVAPADAFAVGRAPTPHALRVCLAPPADDTELRRGLSVLAGLVESAPNRRMAMI